MKNKTNQKKHDSVLIDAKSFGVHEECGIIGIHTADKSDVARDIYYGLFALQHRGQESVGIAVGAGSGRIAYYKNMGLVNDVFGEEELKLLPDSEVGIGHVRYSTTGSSNVVNAQPVVFYGRYGRMAIAHNGNIVNADAIKQTMLSEGHIFQSSIDSEVVAALINKNASVSLESGVVSACKQLVGSFAMVIMTSDKLIAIRDKHGLRPLVMGEKDGKIIFASESCALDAVEAKILRDVEPAEMIVVDGSGVKSVKWETGNAKHCIFEYVYLSRSDSVLDDVSVYEARYQCGMLFAKLYRIDADIVAGVPDSALVCARGYSEISGIPYVDALSKNRYIGRSFIQPSQSMRETSVKIKLNAFRSNINGKRIILMDDSIVRGTTSKKIIKLLRQNGAKEVHMLVASPIVKHTCNFGVDMDTVEQLIGGTRDCDEICKIIGADSLHYLPLDLLKQACGGGDNFCTGCFDGNYAMDISKFCCEKLMLE